MALFIIIFAELPVDRQPPIISVILVVTVVV